jgi:MFS family permease
MALSGSAANLPGSSPELPSPRATGILASAWTPLANAVFRGLWMASVASNIGTWVHEVAANWLMTSLAPSPLIVSLIQTAESLPIFLLSLVAGALADVVDRRKLLIFAQGWMLISAAILGIMTLTGSVTPASLLAFTFLLSIGTALHGPAWLAIIPELVPRKDVPPAVALTSVGLNTARAAGPAVGGLIVALAGPGAAFLLNAVSFLAVVVVLYRWERPATESVLPGERIWDAMLAGLRYARHEPGVWAVLIRCGVFLAGASAIWGLMPLYARQNLGRGAAGYGVILGCLGAGAVVGGTMLPTVRQRFKTEHFLGFSTTIFGLAVIAMALWPYYVLACVAMAIAGSGWTTLFSSFNTSLQMRVPSWVRGRMLALYQLVLFGGMAAGSVLWGAIAQRSGIPMALLASGIVVILGLLAAIRYPIDAGAELDLAPSSRPMPELTAEPHPDRGPVLVSIEYQIDPARAVEFKALMREMGRTRRRDGALRWGLFEDVAKPGLFVENFIVESWVGHMRQHERATVADRDVEARARAFHTGSNPPAVTHYVYAYDNT